MLSRLIEYVWPLVPDKNNPALPIKKLADELEGDSSTQVLGKLYESQCPVQKLFSAVEKGDLDAVRNYIETRGMNVDSVRLVGHYVPQSAETPLLVAIHHRKWDVVRYLLDQDADVDFQGVLRKGNPTYDRYSPLHRLALSDDKEANELFKYAVEEKDGNLDAIDAYGRTILHHAIISNNRTLFDYCLDHGALADWVPRWQTGCGQAPITTAALWDRLDMAKILLEGGVDVNGQQKPGDGTPLTTAAYNPNRVPMMELLIKHGADVNRPGVNGNTALHNAVKCGDQDNIAFLISHGADAYLKNGFDKSAFDISAEQTLTFMNIDDEIPERSVLQNR